VYQGVQQQNALQQLVRLTERARRASEAETITLREGDRLLRDIGSALEESAKIESSREVGDAAAALRKLQEAVLTWRLEARLDKKQILERYLNIIELGPKLFGLRAAAKYWFNLSPRELNVKQAAFLAALTSQPTSMSKRVRRAGGVDPETNERILIILAAMRRDGVIDEATWLDARMQKLWFAASAVPPDR
jgi:membrane peptidoglycan carboxypeptidase